MPFSELIKLKEKLGSKVYNEAMFGANAKDSRKRRATRTEYKRENKNRPREVSAKKQVPLLGVTKPKSKRTETDGPRDPRFDSRCGEFDRNRFKEDYEFVNEIRQKEAIELKEQLKHLGSGDSEGKKKVKLLLQRMENQNLEEKKLKERKLARAEEKSKVKDAVKNDKKPFFTSKRESIRIRIPHALYLIAMHFVFSGEQKAQELVKQYLELKDSGRLNKHLEKRRKKNTARDRKKYSFDWNKIASLLLKWVLFFWLLAALSSHTTIHNLTHLPDDICQTKNKIVGNTIAVCGKI